MAHRVATSLQKRGFRAFFDIHDLREPGLFDVRLLDAIENALDFLIVLTPHALDRCADEKDWVRREIEHAFDVDQNIIPILAQNFEYPDIPLPPKMAALPRLQGIEPSHHEWPASIDRLCGMLRARSQVRAERRMFVMLTSLLLACLAIDATWRLGVTRAVLSAAPPRDDLFIRDRIGPQSKQSGTNMDTNLDWSMALKRANIQVQRWRANPQLKSVVAGKWSLYGTSASTPMVLRVTEWQFIYTDGDESTTVVVFGEPHAPITRLEQTPGNDLFVNEPELQEVASMLPPMTAIGAAFAEGGVIKSNGLLTLRSLIAKNESTATPVWVVPVGLNSQDSASILIHARSGEMLSPRIFE